MPLKQLGVLGMAYVILPRRRTKQRSDLRALPSRFGKGGRELARRPSEQIATRDRLRVGISEHGEACGAWARIRANSLRCLANSRRGKEAQRENVRRGRDSLFVRCGSGLLRRDEENIGGVLEEVRRNDEKGFHDTMSLNLHHERTRLGNETLLSMGKALRTKWKALAWAGKELTQELKELTQ